MVTSISIAAQPSLRGPITDECCTPKLVAGIACGVRLEFLAGAACHTMCLDRAIAIKRMALLKMLQRNADEISSD